MLICGQILKNQITMDKVLRAGILDVRFRIEDFG